MSVQTSVKTITTDQLNTEASISIMDAEVLRVANEQIKRIEPIVKAHGGGVEVLSATPEKLVIALKGHCAGCAMAPITYGMVLNKYIKEALPKIQEIKYVEIK